MKGQLGAVGRALVAGTTALSMTAAPMAAQTRENGRWTRVERLEPGTRIEVLVQDGRSVTGLFEGATAEGLVVAVQGGAGLGAGNWHAAGSRRHPRDPPRRLVAPLVGRGPGGRRRVLRRIHRRAECRPPRLRRQLHRRALDRRRPARRGAGRECRGRLPPRPPARRRLSRRGLKHAPVALSPRGSAVHV